MTPIVLQVKTDAKGASADFKALGRDIQAVLDRVKEQVASTSASLKELTFNPRGILTGADQAERALRSVGLAGQGAERSLTGVSRAGAQTGEALKGTGAQATTTAAKIGKLEAAGTSAATALGEVAKSADTADVALDALDEGAAMAQKSVGGLARAAGGALTRLDALNGAAFDPAGVVAGADEGTSALERLKIAAAEAKASIRSAGGGSPIFVGGGRGAGRGAAEREAGTFGGGLRAGAGAVGDLAGGAAAITTLVAGVSGKLAAHFDNMLQGVRGNTTMGDKDAADMRRLTLRLMKTGTPEEEIAKAYGHIQNMNYRGQDAGAILAQANKLGVATHTSVEDTGQVLARLLREYNQPAARVRAVAETAHLTSAGGDMYLKQFDQYAGKAYATGAASHVSMPEVSAMLQAMTQHGIDIAKASTQAVGLITQMRNPTPQAMKYAKSIGLGDYLGAKALEKYQPSGILAAVAEKTGNDPQKIGNIFKAQRGGLGAGILTGMGAQTYDNALNNKQTGTKAAFAGKTDAITPAYNAQMKQTQQQFAALGGEIKSDFIPIGEKLGPVFAAAIPVIRATANVVKILLDGFTKLPKPVQEAILGLGALKLISAFLPMLGGFALISEKTATVLGGLGKMLLGIGPAAAAGEEGIAGAGAVLGGPFLAGAAAAIAIAAALALAWKTDFGGIRETTAKVGAEVMGFINSQFGYVVKWFKTNLPEIREVVKTVLTTMQEFWHAHGQRIMAILNPLWSFIKTLFSGALHIILAVVKLAMDVMTGHWGAAAKDIGVIVTNLWAIVRSLFVNGVKMVGNILAGIVDLILDLGKRLFEAALNLGQQIINGIVGGIKSGIASVGGAIKNVADAAVASAKSALDIHSPSRVMHEIGLNTAEGLAQGIRDGKVSVDAASRMLATSPREIVRNAISDARRGAAAGKKHAGQVHTAGEFAATVGESPEAKELHKLNENRAKGLISAQQYGEAYARIQEGLNKKAETEARRHESAMERARSAQALAQKQAGARTAKIRETEQQVSDSLSAFTASPDTPSLDKQEGTAHAEYRRQIKDLGGDSLGPYTSAQQKAMTDAATLLQDKLAAIGKQRTDKEAAETQAALDEADAAQKQAMASTVQLNRELWQHAGGDMKAYFQSLRDEADAALKAVTDKFGPASAHPNAPAVDAATGEHTARLATITQQETDAGNQLADARQQHDLEQGKISLAQYIDYLTKRRDAYAQYSQEWLALDSQVYAADEEMQKKQLQSIEDLFQAHKISLEQYKKLLGDLAAQVPLASPVHQDVLSAANGAENRSAKEMVGGDDFWKGLQNSAAENGSRILDALFHPKERKNIFKSMWTDLLGSAEDGLKGGLSNILKNLLSGTGNGFNLSSLFGGGNSGGGGMGSLLGGGSGAASSMGMMGSLMGLGAMTGLPLAGLMPNLQGINLQGINGPVGGGAAGGGLGSLLGMGGLMGHGGILGGLLGHGGLAGMFAHGGLMTSGGALGALGPLLPWLGGGMLLNSVFGNPLGKLFKGFSLKKLFHFASGGLVPGTGNGDTVPAMLTPGEMVLPKSLTRLFLAQASAPSARLSSLAGIERQSYAAEESSQGRSRRGEGGVHIDMWGEHHYHSDMDAERVGRSIARVADTKRRNMTPPR